jgi:hypothetical protein
MKQKTIELQNQIQQFEYVHERLELLKNQYEGETAYIIAAGPSLNNYSINQLKKTLGDKLVLCIKQPYHNLKDITDFLFLNFTNLSPYQFQQDTIVSWAFWFKNHPEAIAQQGWKADLLFPIFRNENIDNKISQSIAYQGDFDNITFEKSLPRPWGPGLMYELAIPMALHLGCKEIVTIGWDIGDINLWKNPNDEEERHFVEHFYSPETPMYDKFKMDAEEVKLITKSVSDMNAYLNSQGVSFKIVSDRNPADLSVPRINLEDIK